MRQRVLTLAFSIAALAACGGKPRQGPPADAMRDWSAHPVFAVQTVPATRLWVISDVHGGIDRLGTLLRDHGIIDGNRAWSGGTDRLYVLGDMIDKSTGGLDTLRFLRDLQVSAATVGGQVVVTMGNHEAEFLVEPVSDKTALFVADLQMEHLDPFAVARGVDIGAWVRTLPFAAKDGDWFLSHAGNTRGLSLDALEDQIRTDVDAHGFAAPSVIGIESLLESELWWQTADPVATLTSALTALWCKHLVFGHDPSALGHRGSLGQLHDGRMFLIDVGMSPAVNDSLGALLLIDHGLGNTVVSAGFPGGSKAILFEE